MHRDQQLAKQLQGLNSQLVSDKLLRDFSEYEPITLDDKSEGFCELTRQIEDFYLCEKEKDGKPTKTKGEALIVPLLQKKARVDQGSFQDSFMALESLPDESKQSFLNYIKEQQYISQVDDGDFEILESEETKDLANGQEAPDLNFQIFNSVFEDYDQVLSFYNNDLEPQPRSPPFLDRVMQGYTNFAFMFRHNGSKEVDFMEDISKKPAELSNSSGS